MDWLFIALNISSLIKPWNFNLDIDPIHYHNLQSPVLLFFCTNKGEQINLSYICLGISKWAKCIRVFQLFSSQFHFHTMPFALDRLIVGCLTSHFLWGRKDFKSNHTLNFNLQSRQISNTCIYISYPCYIYIFINLEKI